MKIGIDTRLQNESGVGRYIRNLTEQLKAIDKKNNYTLLNPSIKWHSLSEQLLMPLHIYKANVDIMHFPYFNVPILYFGNFIVTIHDLTISHIDTGKASTRNMLIYKLKRLGYKIVLWSAINRSEIIITPTKAVKKDILNHYDVEPRKIKVIYEGVDQKIQITNYKLQITSLTNVKQYFLYVGNAYPHKNLNRLLDAFKVLITHHTSHITHHTKLVLVGKQDYFYKKLKQDENVIFTGHVSDAELAWLYQNALALVYPSLMEGFGLPALEAMQNNCLVLCSNIPALKEICGNSAIYFNPQDTNDMSSRMKEVLKNRSKYNRKIKSGKKRASEFSWKKTALETLKIYESSSSIRSSK